VQRATSEEWSRYYERARRRRQTVGDPIERYLERRDQREQRFFVASTALLATVLVAFYFVLAR
jgi:type II secretory pathway component PulM